MPPSSMNNIPRSHKKVVRQHRKLFWVLIGILGVSLFASTVAIVLGAVMAHHRGQNGATCAAIIVGIFGFSGMVGSAAVIWFILTGRKENARLEKRWADEEKVREARSVRERQTESQLRESIRNRDRSLSGSRSRGRGRGRDRVTRPAVRRIPSFIAMTPTPTSSIRMPDQNAHHMSGRARSPWPRPMDVSNDVDDDLGDENDNENDSNHDDNGHDVKKCGGGRDKEGKAQAGENRRDSASSQYQDLDSLDSENEENNKAETDSRPDTAIREQNTLSEVGRNMPLNTSATYINPSPMKPYPTAYRLDDSPRIPPIEHTPFEMDTVRSNDVGIDLVRGDHDNPPSILRRQNGTRCSAQSDENFQAMLDLADDAGSEDEKDRQLRRQKGKESAAKWASPVNAEAGAGEREEKGRKLREAVERGIQRVANRKKQRREGVVGVEARVMGEG